MKTDPTATDSKGDGPTDARGWPGTDAAIGTDPTLRDSDGVSVGADGEV